MSSSLISSSSSEETLPASPLASMFDVTCGVDFVIGTGRLKIREFLGLTRHAVVTLDQTAGADWNCV